MCTITDFIYIEIINKPEIASIYELLKLYN
jgi:hypothetical protein